MTGTALNFANIIARPLLLGVGGAFKIYYTRTGRAGKTGLLQLTLTRAVIFSAMTNAIAFGSMAVEVTTDDGKTYTAKVIGTDARTDVALIKVEGGSNFPFAKLSDGKPDRKSTR